MPRRAAAHLIYILMFLISSDLPVIIWCWTRIPPPPVPILGLAVGWTVIGIVDSGSEALIEDLEVVAQRNCFVHRHMGHGSGVDCIVRIIPRCSGCLVFGRGSGGMLATESYKYWAAWLTLRFGSQHRYRQLWWLPPWSNPLLMSKEFWSWDVWSYWIEMRVEICEECKWNV